MRVLVTLLITVGVISLEALDNPKVFADLWARLSSKATTVMNDKEVRIEGLNRLPRAEIERLLPLDRTVAWWHANGTEIQAALRQNPWIAEAHVTSCPNTIASRWGCFVVSIEERVATFLATVDDAQWLIDQEGSFIVPHAGGVLKGTSRRMVTVRGLASKAKSPDLVHAQLAAASKLLPVLEKRVKRAITGLEFQGQGDFAVSFEGLPFPIIFGAGKDSRVSLSEQGERCFELLKHLSGRLGEIQKVDLAFNQVGVVTFLPTAVPTP